MTMKAAFGIHAAIQNMTMKIGRNPSTSSKLWRSSIRGRLARDNNQATARTASNIAEFSANPYTNSSTSSS